MQEAPWHSLQEESWDRLPLGAITHPPRGAELVAQPKLGEVCRFGRQWAGAGALGTPPACVCLCEDKLVVSQSKLSSRINLVMAHMGAPQRAVMEGRDLLRSERVGKLIHKG